MSDQRGIRLKNQLKSLYVQSRYYIFGSVYKNLWQRIRPNPSALFNADLLMEPESCTIMTLSPHPDDDILAAGGALYLHALRKSRITSLIITDGSRGYIDNHYDNSLVDQRKQEVVKASEIIGISQHEFLSIPDGEVRKSTVLVEMLIQRLNDIKPDIIYAPFVIDYHWDHVYTLEAMLSAIRKTGWIGKIRCYECIMPLIPNLLCDISSCIDKKRTAVACFHTQNSVSDYLNTIVEGLNRLRTHGLLRGQGYAEAFFQTDPEFLEDLVHQFTGTKPGL